jgi:DNA mismatch repair ATPase MutS
LNTPSELHLKKWPLVVRWILPVINLIALYYFIANDTGYYYLPILITGGCSWLVLAFFSKYINGQHVLISKKEQVLDQYKSILSVFNSIDAKFSALLKNLHVASEDAVHAIHSLARLSQAFDQRLNLVISLFGNTIFLYDLHTMVLLEKWKAKYKDHFARWIDCVGNIEYLNSLACFAYNNSNYVYPEVRTGKSVIETKQVAHPLIAEEKRIANDFILGENEQIQLITGSNMSGKTTFLRTIGVNLLLAQCGAPVCAASFLFTPMQLLSSIRISDSLQENTSYFMAELKRLHEIILELQTGKSALVLIDEILRGTNSEDKTHGSEQFIRKLLQYHCICLFATHDLTLGKLEQEMPMRVSNYCFESTIRDNELFFDYTLQKGIAKNKNASFLMKKMDII